MTPCCRPIGDKGPYTVTVYLWTGRGAAAPRARNCPGTAAPGPVRGNASGHWLALVRAVQTVAAHKARVSSRPLTLRACPWRDTHT